MQTPENVLGALVKQVVHGLEAIPTENTVAFQKAKNQVGGRGLRIPESRELLKAAVAPFSLAFVCIDALDELSEKHLPKLLPCYFPVMSGDPFFLLVDPILRSLLRNIFPQVRGVSGSSHPGRIL